MRRISFALTRDSFLDGSKTVTRRKGWKNLKPGTRLLAVSKCMGLKPGESAEVYGPIEVVSAVRQPLNTVVAWDEFEVVNQPGTVSDHHWAGNDETAAEGFPELSGIGFVAFFREHMGGTRDQLVTRIEFHRVDPRALDGVKLSPAMRRALLDLKKVSDEQGLICTMGGRYPTGTTWALQERQLLTIGQRYPGRFGSPVWALTRLGRQVATELKGGCDGR